MLIYTELNTENGYRIYAANIIEHLDKLYVRQEQYVIFG